MSTGVKALRALFEEYEDCKRCPSLCESRSQVVFGSGSSSADIVIVGEAPGGGEDEEGIPFVGPSGQLLMDILANAWPQDDRLEEIKSIPKDRDEEYFRELRDYLDDYIFWMNIVCCKPEDNRNPSTQEIKNCKDRLHRSIYAIDPMLVVAAGKVAASVLVGKNVAIVQNRGTIYDSSILSPKTGEPIRYPVLAILHPSYLKRKGDQALASQRKGETYKTMEDLRYGIELLDAQYQDLYSSNFPHRRPHE